MRSLVSKYSLNKGIEILHPVDFFFFSFSFTSGLSNCYFLCVFSRKKSYPWGLIIEKY